MREYKRYEVLCGKKWYRCRVASLLPSGWLEWRTYDGTTGLAQPGKFREIIKKPSPVEPSTART